MTGGPAKRDQAASRREFLKKVLRAGVYAAPAVAFLSMRNIASAQSSMSKHWHP